MFACVRARVLNVQADTDGETALHRGNVCPSVQTSVRPCVRTVVQQRMAAVLW